MNVTIYSTVTWLLPTPLEGQPPKRFVFEHVPERGRKPLDGELSIWNRRLLKVIITSPQGEERILAILGPGEIAGELSIIDRQPRSASVIAIKDCELSFISQQNFEKYTKQDPDIYRYLVNVLAARLRETDEAVAADSFLTVKARVARALLELSEYLGEDAGAGRVLIHHKINQNDLAAMAGVARENVSRALGDWKRRDLVTRSSGFYYLNDITTLKRSMGERPRASRRPTSSPRISEKRGSAYRPFPASRVVAVAEARPTASAFQRVDLAPLRRGFLYRHQPRRPPPARAKRKSPRLGGFEVDP
jgi:CRP/FNR family cyclic AMP-dependent transcriptional regulator